MEASGAVRRKLHVLVADDSVVYRSQLRAALTTFPEVETVAVASNGRVAIDRLLISDFDLLVLDLEMPEMDGLQTLREISRRGIKTKVLIFSSRSKRGAEITMEALAAGASDFVAKPGAGDAAATDLSANPSDLLAKLLRPKIEALFSLDSAQVESAAAQVSMPASVGSYPKIDWTRFEARAVVIGSSTGGPNALEEIFAKISGPLRAPIFITQHMPPIFTATLAERLQKISGIEAHEGRDGELVSDSRIYMAPGDYHMTIEKSTQGPRISLNQRPQENFVRPAVDPMFRSAAEVYGSQLLGVVLTGMGADGRIGAQAVKAAGGAMLIQSAESCVVYGMPRAVFECGAFDRSMDLDEVTNAIIEKVANAKNVAANKLVI
jgi:two-component system, chemotaxis family, protein-glutamate methylesterase/glutaminase